MILSYTKKNYTCGIIQHCTNYLICYMIKLSHYFSIFTPMWTYARRNALRGKRYCLFLFFLFFQLFWWQHSRDEVVSQKNLTFHITFHGYWKTHSPWNNKMQKKRKLIFFSSYLHIMFKRFYSTSNYGYENFIFLSHMGKKYLLTDLPWQKKICLGNTYMLYVVLL